MLPKTRAIEIEAPGKIDASIATGGQACSESIFKAGLRLSNEPRAEWPSLSLVGASSKRAAKPMKKLAGENRQEFRQARSQVEFVMRCLFVQTRASGIALGKDYNEREAKKCRSKAKSCQPMDISLSDAVIFAMLLGDAKRQVACLGDVQASHFAIACGNVAT
ncbi:MAG TPA: hypothetical protein VHH73_18405 [Verrucomicrobiae bacterium]|nr:hypothetical protein [Verrucomicrobiae bacterium]